MVTETETRDPVDPRLGGLIEGLQDRAPKTDLWPGVAGRITRRPRGVLQLRWPVALAAGVSLVAASAALTLWLRPGSGIDGTPSGVLASTADSAAALVLPAGFGDATAALTAAIDNLEGAIAAAGPKLDPAARRRIDESLAALDRAITDARNRAGRAPDDIGAARYLTRTMQRKLDVLQSVATMMGRS